MHYKTLITIDIFIIKKHIQTKRQSLIKNSKEESHFIKELVCSIKSININAIQSIDTFEFAVQTFSSNINRIWHKHSKVANITKYSKAWWDDNCHRDLDMYRHSKQLKD